MSTFLEGINRVLRVNGFLGDDDDDLTSFTTTQHQASLNIAKIAIQTTLTSLISDQMIPYEEAETTLTYVTSQRTYDLASDFVRFSGKEAYLAEMDGTEISSFRVFKYKGGEDRLRRTIHNYRDTEGQPIWWYWVNATTKKIGFYPVPDSNQNGKELKYFYEKDVSVSIASDTLPLQNTMEFDAFTNMAARTMKYIFESLPAQGLESDIVYSEAKSTLAQLMRPDNPSTRYGFLYR